MRSPRNEGQRSFTAGPGYFWNEVVALSGKVLITGGAGFIGRHVSRLLLERGFEVVVLDSLIDQVHHDRAPPHSLRDAEFILADVRDQAAVRRGLRGADYVVHLAAEVGVGQSMYATERYVSANDLGTAVLLQEMAQSGVRRVVVASSMSVYGEGLYKSADGRFAEATIRNGAGSSGWDPIDDEGRPLVPVATPETKPVSLRSVYALTKYVQERMTLVMAEAYGVEAVALRLFNVFGSGQALSNPYTGVLAIFAARLLNGRKPVVFEDGLQRRDFVHVGDVAEAFASALSDARAAGGVFNIGSGRNYSILEVARMLAAAMGRPDLEPDILGKARAGDIRHCFADIGLAGERLGYRPKRQLETGLGELVEWVMTQAAVDRVFEARAELETRGLVT